MKEITHISKLFKNIAHSDSDKTNKEFENCTFTNCDFSNGVFSYSKFIDCIFTNCNLSNAKLNRCQMNNVTFKDCKLIGINFMECNDFLFALKFENCVLDYASFSKKKMPKTPFISTSTKNVDFTESDLTKSLFFNSDLSNAIFYKSLLKEADFTGAANFDIDPENNIVKKAKFSLTGIPGLLKKYDIHIE